MITGKNIVSLQPTLPDVLEAVIGSIVQAKNVQYYSQKSEKKEDLGVIIDKFIRGDLARNTICTYLKQIDPSSSYKTSQEFQDINKGDAGCDIVHSYHTDDGYMLVTLEVKSSMLSFKMENIDSLLKENSLIIPAEIKNEQVVPPENMSCVTIFAQALFEKKPDIKLPTEKEILDNTGKIHDETLSYIKDKFDVEKRYPLVHIVGWYTQMDLKKLHHDGKTHLWTYCGKQHWHVPMNQALPMDQYPIVKGLFRSVQPK